MAKSRKGSKRRQRKDVLRMKGRIHASAETGTWRMAATENGNDGLQEHV